MKYLLLFAVLFGLLVGGAAIAQEADVQAIQEAELVTLEDLEVEDPGLLPTSPFYFFKEWRRGAQSFFTFNSVAKAEFEVKVANEKAAELKVVEEQRPDDENAINRALSNFQRAKQRVSTRLERLQETSDNPNVDRLLNNVVQNTVVHGKLIDGIKERQQKKEGGIAARIAAAIDEVDREGREALESLGELDTPEKFVDRIKGALDRSRGSEFKDIRSIEFIDRVEEKFSDEVKARLNGVRDGLRERVKAKIEVESANGGEKLKAIFESIPGDPSRRAVVLEEIRVKSSDRAANALGRAQEAVERKVADSSDRKEKSAEQIRRASNILEKAKIVVREQGDVRPAIKNLLEGAEKHLDAAKRAFEVEEFGEAFGQARAAEVGAKNALRALESKGEEDIVELERIEQRVKERVLLPKRVLDPETENRVAPRQPGTFRSLEQADCRAKGGEWVITNVLGAEPTCVLPKETKQDNGREVVCTKEHSPVCGANGITYSNRCVAEQQNGVRVAHNGECGTGLSPEEIRRIEEKEKAELQTQSQKEPDTSRQNRLEEQLQLQFQELDRLQKQLQDQKNGTTGE